MQKRESVTSGTIWEQEVGYARAVRLGNCIEVSGTTAMDASGSLVGLDDAYQQTVFILKKIEKAINQLGGTLQDVVRTRMFVTDIAQWEVIGKAHGTFFADIKPVTTMVEVSKLIEPDLLVEIEATAWVINP
ncbi:MAG: RidA family protein [Saprospiraceae bacterium]|nr:RidA family protein [Saprospiraceae bacterium]